MLCHNLNLGFEATQPIRLKGVVSPRIPNLGVVKALATDAKQFLGANFAKRQWSKLKVVPNTCFKMGFLMRDGL